jgi:hypothetical protein
MLPSTILNTLLVVTFATFNAHWNIDAKQVCSDLTRGSKAIDIYKHFIRKNVDGPVSVLELLHDHNKRQFNSFYGKHATNGTTDNSTTLKQYEMYVSIYAYDFARFQSTQDLLPVLSTELGQHVSALCPSGRPRKLQVGELMKAFSKIKETYRRFVDTEAQGDAAIRRLATLSCSCGWRDMELGQCFDKRALNHEHEHCISNVLRCPGFPSFGSAFLEEYRSLRLWWLSY